MRQTSLQRRLAAWWVMVGALAVLSFAGRAASDEEPAGDAFYRYETFVFGLLFYGLLLGATLLIAAGLDLRQTFAFRRPASWGRAVWIMLGAFVGMWIAAVILEQIFHAGDEQGLDPERITTSRVPPFLVNLVLTAIVVPVVEEMIYRGLGFSLLEQFGQVAAIAVTAFAFALAHGIVEGLPVFFVIGAALAFVRSRTGSLYPAIAMHAFFNGAQMMLGAFL
jgi:membrane protease YdiL (CAAX protease family)